MKDEILQQMNEQEFPLTGCFVNRVCLLTEAIHSCSDQSIASPQANLARRTEPSILQPIKLWSVPLPSYIHWIRLASVTAMFFGLWKPFQVTFVNHTYLVTVNTLRPRKETSSHVKATFGSPDLERCFGNLEMQDRGEHLHKIGPRSG
jgi:hypothetical protein